MLKKISLHILSIDIFLLLVIFITFRIADSFGTFIRVNPYSIVAGIIVLISLFLNGFLKASLEHEMKNNEVSFDNVVKDNPIKKEKSLFWVFSQLNIFPLLFISIDPTDKPFIRMIITVLYLLTIFWFINNQTKGKGLYQSYPLNWLGYRLLKVGDASVLVRNKDAKRILKDKEEFKFNEFKDYIII